MSGFDHVLARLRGPIAPSASIVSDGCRDYVVELHQPQGDVPWQSRLGGLRRFSSLAQAKSALRAAGVTDIRLAIRIAADEACAGPSLRDTGFAVVPVVAENRPRGMRDS